MSSQINSLVEGESYTTWFSFENRVLTQIVACNVLHETPGFYVVFQPPEPFRNWNLLVPLLIHILCPHQPSARTSTGESSLSAWRKPTLKEEHTAQTETKLLHPTINSPRTPPLAQLHQSLLSPHVSLMLSIQQRHPGAGFHPKVPLLCSAPAGAFGYLLPTGRSDCGSDPAPGEPVETLPDLVGLGHPTAQYFTPWLFALFKWSLAKASNLITEI